MKIVVQESHLGEFETTTEDEFAHKLERGIDALRHSCGSSSISKATPKFFGEVVVIDNLAQILAGAFEARLTAMKKDIVKAVKDGGI